MRYTPFLDSRNITFKADVPDHAVNIIDSCLAVIERTVNWGEWQGRRRKPCHEQPILLTGMPIGQYHCPGCGDMQLASIPHLDPDPDYELVMGREWPWGYEDPGDGESNGLA